MEISFQKGSLTLVAINYYIAFSTLIKQSENHCEIYNNNHSFKL